MRTIHITSRDPAPPPVAYLKNSGGIFMDMTSHDFDMARFLVRFSLALVVATVLPCALSNVLLVEAMTINWFCDGLYVAKGFVLGSPRRQGWYLHLHHQPGPFGMARFLEGLHVAP